MVPFDICDDHGWDIDTRNQLFKKRPQRLLSGLLMGLLGQRSHKNGLNSLPRNMLLYKNNFVAK
jgi:hypothetical protein